MDKKINIEKIKIDLQVVEETHQLCCKKRLTLEQVLNKLQQDIITMKNKLETTKYSLQYYKTVYQNLLLKLENIIVQQDKAKMAHIYTKNVIQKYEIFHEDDIEDDIVVEEEVNIDKSRIHFAIEKEKLLREKDQLQCQIKKNNELIKNSASTS